MRIEDDMLWFERTGSVEPDLEAGDPRADETVARALGIDHSLVGLEARELGRSGRLRPACADAGLRQLIVPLKNVEALEACSPDPKLLADLARDGVYCVAPQVAGRVRARGFFPGLGVSEDPATGSAAAALGLFLADRTGEIRFEVVQGVEISRPSRISFDATSGSVRVGGKCGLLISGRMEGLS